MPVGKKKGKKRGKKEKSSRKNQYEGIRSEAEQQETIFVVSHVYFLICLFIDLNMFVVLQSV